MVRASHIEYVQYREVHYKLCDPVDEFWWCSAWNFDGSECWVKVKSAEVETRLAMDTTPFPWQRPANPQANLIQLLAYVDQITYTSTPHMGRIVWSRVN